MHYPNLNKGPGFEKWNRLLFRFSFYITFNCQKKRVSNGFQCKLLLHLGELLKPGLPVRLQPRIFLAMTVHRCLRQGLQH